MESVELNGKTVVVTGANTGIGKFTAQCLAQKGARVILGCRSEERGRQAAIDIQNITGNTQVIFKKLDLSSLESVREFCRDFDKNERRLDILINNAGVITHQRHVSPDGNELMLAVNFLGPFLLTHLLLEKLKSSRPSRVVNVSSRMYENNPFRFDDVQSQTSFDYLKAYGRSKTAGVMATVHLAGLLQGSGVTVNSVHPGVIQTDLMRDQPLFKNTCFRLLFPYLMRCCTGQRVVSIAEGSRTTLYCALDPSVAQISGRYYSECEEKEIKDFAKDAKENERLWDLACELCGIDETPPGAV